ncbi:hypothetical protein FACS189498_4280 [Spirochaetia bacterium]|nr:hypothetical protein FACS189498_4280 [Spirochaetia bacterium]
MDCFEKRREKVYDWMARENISLAMVEDFEHKRDPTVRWLTGQPGDALVFLSVERKCVLVPWDINMARLYGHAEFIIPYNEFERQPVKAAAHAAAFFKIPRGSRIEIPSVTAYPQFLKFVEDLMDFDVICRDDGLAKETAMLRAIKDEDEIALYRKISGITNTLIDMLEKNVSSGKIKTESDAALFLEAETRKRGCEGTGFETLAAGPDRSFGIHCFPSYTAGDFAGPGLSILDFGVKYAGYTSDVTLTFARGPLSKIQEKQISLRHESTLLDLRNNPHQQRRYPFGIFGEDFGDGLPGNRLLLHFPGIVIGAHGGGGVGDARLFCQGGFGGDGHIDNIRAPGLKHPGFRPGGKTGAFNGDNRSPGVKRKIPPFTFFNQKIPELFVERVCHGAVDGIVGLKTFMKGHLPLFGKINKLIDDDNIAPANFFPQ